MSSDPFAPSVQRFTSCIFHLLTSLHFKKEKTRKSKIWCFSNSHILLRNVEEKTRKKVLYRFFQLWLRFVKSKPTFRFSSLSSPPHFYSLSFYSTNIHSSYFKIVFLLYVILYIRVFVSVGIPLIRCARTVLVESVLVCAHWLATIWKLFVRNIRRSYGSNSNNNTNNNNNKINASKSKITFYTLPRSTRTWNKKKIHEKKTL